jgi:hypothetical protein
MSRMLPPGYSLFDVQGLKCNFHLQDKPKHDGINVQE